MQNWKEDFFMSVRMLGGLFATLSEDGSYNLTTGGYTVLVLVNPGDEVIIPTPAFVLYEQR